MTAPQPNTMEVFETHSEEDKKFRKEPQEVEKTEEMTRRVDPSTVVYVDKDDEEDILEDFIVPLNDTSGSKDGLPSPLKRRYHPGRLQASLKDGTKREFLLDSWFKEEAQELGDDESENEDETTDEDDILEAYVTHLMKYHHISSLDICLPPSRSLSSSSDTRRSDRRHV